VTSKYFQDMFEPNISYHGSQGSSLFINSPTARIPLRYFQEHDLRCSLARSFKAVSPYFVLFFSFSWVRIPVRIG